jgi:hypothetical protein
MGMVTFLVSRKEIRSNTKEKKRGGRSKVVVVVVVVVVEWR